MKNVIILAFAICLALPVFAQKHQLLGDDIGILLLRIDKASPLSARFKALAKTTLGVEEDDCIPPPCTGIIDPWTCECISDIKDPWGNEALNTRLKNFQAFEAAISRGEGKDILTRQHYSVANKKYPGKGLKAIVNRLNFYASVGK